MNRFSVRVRVSRTAVLGCAIALLFSTLAVGGVSGASNPAPGVTAAKAYSAQYLHNSSNVGITVALKHKPAPETVAWLQLQLPATELFTPFYQAAAKALGWKLITIPFNETDPASAANAMSQAVSDHVNYIIAGGFPLTAYAAGYSAAKAAHIPIVMTSVANDATYTAANDVLGCDGCTNTVVNRDTIMAEYTIENSNGHAHALFVDIPDFPILPQEDKVYTDTIKKNCHSCTVATLNETTASLSAGTLPTDLVAYLQSHPSINYVHFPFGGMEDGILAAMQTAGITSKINFTLTDPDAYTMNALKSGKFLASGTFPNGEFPWQVMDVMARNSEGMSIQPSISASVPSWVVTPKTVNSVTTTLPNGPTNFESTFKTLWKVNS